MSESEKKELKQRIEKVEQLYRKANVFEQAYRLVDKHEQRSLEAAAEIESHEMQRLLLYLVDTVLERSDPSDPNVVPIQTVQSLPIAATQS